MPAAVGVPEEEVRVDGVFHAAQLQCSIKSGNGFPVPHQCPGRTTPFQAHQGWKQPPCHQASFSNNLPLNNHTSSVCFSFGKHSSSLEVLSSQNRGVSEFKIPMAPSQHDNGSLVCAQESPVIFRHGACAPAGNAKERAVLTADMRSSFLHGKPKW